MYVRVWEYDVPAGAVDAFLEAYGSEGAWAQLFARTPGYAGTRLFRDVDEGSRFLTVDRWADSASWDAFLDRWENDYRELDVQSRRLAAGGEAVIDGPA